MFRLLLAILTLALLGQTAFSQLPLDDFKGIKIRNIGPAGMSGRVTSIDVDLRNTDRIFVGTASGGVWKTENGGITFEPIFDEQPVQSIGSIAINQQNPAEIWVGTGEGNPRNSHNSGEGIFKSIDGGRTWKRMGLEKTRLIHRIIIHPFNPEVVYVAALGSAWGPNEDRGVYKTTDGGENWKKVLYINDGTGCADLVVDPQNPNKVLAAMWEFGRKPWTFNSGGPGSGLHRSYDGGETWEKVTDKDGLPKGDLGRIGLAIAPSKPDVVYALVEAKKNALYKSTDGGHKWSKVGEKNIGNRPFYYADIFVDPQNENRIYSLHSTVTRSEDGGKTFTTLLPYYDVHPDHHAFWVHPQDGSYLIEGSDGGLNISRDGGANWRFIENLPLAQFYHINIDNDIPYHVMGGMQDNGSWVGPSSMWRSGGLRNQDWQEVLFGDGFDVMLQPDDNRYGYAMYQQGNLNRFDRETGQQLNIKPVHPDGTELRFSWNAALAQDPFTNCGIYFGSQFVHKSTDCGQSWTIISPDLTTNDTTKQKQELSGGLTKDVTGAENYTTILAISPSPKDRNVIWVGTDDGRLQLTQNGGGDWTDLYSRLPGAPKGGWIPQVIASDHQAGEAFVVVNNYRQNDYKPYAYHTSNFGQSWTRIAKEPQVKGHVLSIVQDPIEPNLVFMGTDYGLYISIDGAKNWQQYKNDFPSTPVSDLKIHPRDHDLIVGTFGRAAWILDDIRAFRKIASDRKVLEKDFAVFEPPVAYLAEYRSYDGVRFGTDGIYEGDNKSPNGKFTIWVKPKKKEKKEKAEAEKKKGKKEESKEKAEEETAEKDKKEADQKPKRAKDKIYILVQTMEGDTIREYSTKVRKEQGMQRFSWNLRYNGIRWPSNRDVKKDADKPSGHRVLPGTYKVTMTYQDWIDSTTILVEDDPRMNNSMKTLKAKHDRMVDYYQHVTRATEAFNRMKKAKKSIKLVNQLMESAPDSVQQDIKKQGKAMTDSLNQLMALYMFPPDTKGIQRSSDKLMSYIYRPMGYLNASGEDLSQMAQITVTEAKREIETVVGKVNTFFQNDWKAYREAVEGVQTSPFD